MQATAQSLLKNVVPHASSSVTPVAGQEALSDLRSVNLVFFATVAWRTSQLGIETAPRDTEHLAHQIDWPDSSVLRNKAELQMVHLPYLQPFADINKRTSRLAANLPLFRANLCPLTFIDVPEQAYSRATLGVYGLTRVELLRDLYVWAYERSTQEYLAIKQNLAEPDPMRLV